MNKIPLNRFETADEIIPPARMLPPSYGEPQREAINSVVDNMVQDIIGKIGDLRKQLDEIEQQALSGAAKVKLSLQAQIQVCVRLNDEITHMRGVVETIAAAQPKD
jgi:hypothetical protein